MKRLLKNMPNSKTSYQTHQAELEKIYQGEDTLQKILNMMQQAKRKLDAKGGAMPMARMTEDAIGIEGLYAGADLWLQDLKAALETHNG